ncbi:hypothetical protein B0T16DRAFT_332677 [Cercophora newfieldiana]|uniref:Uncharacterized protein n=1 Tax=Cercophora newfieldiana TaxID=92897 RepID=A0AA39Y2B5_9PEZI|nr:hypothetical protein B0T16DRAFT_332677 [Cercophora newfieldiana]
MVDDSTHKKWHSTRLDEALRDSLGENRSVLEDVAEDITNTVKDIDIGLERFDCLEDVRGKDEHIKDTVKRVRSSLKIAFDKSEFDQWIADLRSANTDLQLLREQVTELTKPKTTACVGVRCSKFAKTPLPSDFCSYGVTRRASRALHDALWTAWSTGDATHFRHGARLFLETKAAESVYLNLAISCLGENIIQQSMIKIHVKSQVLDWIGTDSMSTRQTHHALDRKEPTASEPKRRRVVRFLDDVEAFERPTALENSPAIELTLHAATLDLQASQHFCSRLTSKHLHHPQTASGTRCVGFLDTCTHERFRHEFFHCRDGVCTPAICQGVVCETGTLKRLDHVLIQPRSDELSVQHQLQLAFRIASAVLKFNSTPWLGEYWGLHDLHLFERDSDLPASLQTIHLGATKVTGNPSLMQVDVSDGTTSALEDAKLIHGIQNPTMYNLGIVLLSIGRWSPVDPYDVLKARRVASQTCPLGPRYRELTRKVLDCDFGYGKDLKKPKLQEAVYKDVLLELESMISALSFDEETQ